MILYFIGDVHGKLSFYENITEKLTDGCSIQLGDMGLGFPNSRGLPVLSKRHTFIRGNHDNPDTCRAHDNYLGDYGVATFGGEISDLSDSTTFFLSGAFSIDAAWRTLGRDLWIDEQLNMQQLAAAQELYEINKPAIVVTHDAPKDIADILVNKVLLRKTGSQPNITSMALQNMFNAHKPSVWFFGHHHMFFDQVVKGTRFICLPELRVAQYDTNTREVQILGNI